MEAQSSRDWLLSPGLAVLQDQPTGSPRAEKRLLLQSGDVLNFFSILPVTDKILLNLVFRMNHEVDCSESF